MKNYSIKILILIFVFLGLGNVFEVKAFSEGELANFNIDSSYDLYGKSEISTYLIRATDSLYFYVEKSWWDSRSPQEQNNIRIVLFDLGEEFKNKIYPVLASNFGQEWKPGIDGEQRITVLVHQMKTGRAGYFRISDEYSKFQAPSSNEREMVYLSSEFIATPLAKSFLAHEFVHLITFNQKEKLRRITEETWLNEARAEYAPTLLGYDDQYEGSNLQRRVRIFLETPSFSLTEWQGVSADYGVLNLFTQYLVDQYGVAILRDSLWSSETGIASLSSALRKNGFQDAFSQVFTNWTITVLMNDCSLSSKYCYTNQNLRNLRIVPESNFIPTTTESSLSVYSQIKDWSAKWQRIFGGKGDLTFKFNGTKGVNFEVPYVLCDYAQKCIVKFFDLDAQQQGQVIIPGFNSKYSALTLIPSVQNKLSGFTGNEPIYLFSWDVKTKEFSGQNHSSSCSGVKNNLYFGIRNNAEVSCLQEFLKGQGAAIYPEGLVTGNFLSLTKAAVIRFQEKYASEILASWGLSKGTGYVGSTTRAKINQMLGI